MCDRDDELLLSYLLGDLPEGESSALEQRIEEEPKLKARLKRLRLCLESEDQQEGCPEDLAERTSDSILCPSATGSTDNRCGGLFSRKFSAVDLGAVAVATLLLSSILGPALQYSRDSARRLACEENLRRLGMALIQYSNEEGSFPKIGPEANAGMFTVALADKGYLDREEMQHLLLCPDSELSERVSANQAVVHIPTREELYVAHTLLLDRIRRYMSGDYAYPLGYIDDGVYYPVQEGVRSRAPLLSDSPGEKPNDHPCMNHGGCGQNVLFKDGTLRFVTSTSVPGTSDHLFLNSAREVAPGHGWQDTVLAPSWVSPAASMQQQAR